MTKVQSVSDFSAYIDKYRSEEPVLTVLQEASKIKPDKSLCQELRGYRLFKKEQDIKLVRGPEDFDVLLEVYDGIQRMKDRVCEIQLVYLKLKRDLDALYSVVYSYLMLKREVLGLRNDAQRDAVLAQTIPEVVSLQNEVKSIVEISEAVTNNLNRTYNIAKEQSLAVREKMYWQRLTMPDEDVKRRS